ncbi:MAG: hypothetical protein AB1816_20360 [Bacillota bacterium]
MGEVHVDHREVAAATGTGTRVEVPVPAAEQLFSPYKLVYVFALFKPHARVKIGPLARSRGRVVTMLNRCARGGRIFTDGRVRALEEVPAASSHQPVVEREWFLGRHMGKKCWVCGRVELNAMSAPHLVGFGRACCCTVMQPCRILARPDRGKGAGDCRATPEQARLE